LTTKYENLNARIEKLLPAATGVGLAKSFNSRKKTLNKQAVAFLVVFGISIAGFIWFGFSALENENIKTIDEFFRFALERSPIILGLVLLEEFSRRQFRATTKLEEDYAYKETISIAFDGYKKALKNVDESDSATLANLLGRNVLGTLGQRPGRLLDIEKEHNLPVEQILKGLAAGGEKGNNLEMLTGMFSWVTSDYKIKWVKFIVIFILILLVGFGFGYYFSGITSNLNVGNQATTQSKITSDKNSESNIKPLDKIQGKTLETTQ